MALERRLLRADLEIGQPGAHSRSLWAGEYDLARASGAMPSRVAIWRRRLDEWAMRTERSRRRREILWRGDGAASMRSPIAIRRRRRALGSVASKIGEIELERGNLLAALSNFSHALRIAEGIAASEGANANEETRLNVADTNAQVGEGPAAEWRAAPKVSRN